MEDGIGLIVFWAFASYGLTSIINWGSIFDKPREIIKSHSAFFGELISCTLCTATWMGFFLSILTGGLSAQFWSCWWPIGIFLDGVFTAGVVWAINSIVEFFEEYRGK